MWWALLLNSLVGILSGGGAGGGGTSYESIATASGTGSSGTITFSSIPGTYASLQIRSIALETVGGDTQILRFNSDSASNYARHNIYGQGTSAVALGSASTTSIPVGPMATGLDSTYPSGCIIDIHDYASSTKYKTLRVLTGIDKNGSGDVSLSSGLWMSTSAITSITISVPSFFSTSSVFSLYGIKG